MAAFEMRASTEHRLAHAASPRLQHAVRLLQMSSAEFAAAVREAMGRNPFLEAEEGEDRAGVGLASTSETRAAPEPADSGGAAIGIDDGFVAGLDDARGKGGSIGTLQRAGASLLDAIADEVSLSRHLHGQLALLPLAPRERMLAAALVESLDDDGYLRSPLHELTDIVALDPAVDVVELERALHRVHSLDPAGVGARDVAECLTLQLASIEPPPQRELARRIVAGNLPLLARRDVGALARRLGEDPADVVAACERIRRLDPRPGWRFGSSRIGYVVPDVIVRRQHGRWQVRVNPEVVPRLRLNQSYADLFRSPRCQRHRQMNTLLQEAQWTLRNLDQRFDTLLAVAAAIVRRQHHFLEFGPMAMKPLLLRDIANELGIHESTVSRVTANKYIATPVGVFELKFFFSRVMRSANGSACSGTAIRGLIGEMIAAERPGARLSDVEITRRLAAQGLVVARRTVTKYRQLLRIEPIERRRRAP